MSHWSKCGFGVRAFNIQGLRSGRIEDAELLIECCQGSRVLDSLKLAFCSEAGTKHSEFRRGTDPPPQAQDFDTYHHIHGRAKPRSL